MPAMKNTSSVAAFSSARTLDIGVPQRQRVFVLGAGADLRRLPQAEQGAEQQCRYADAAGAGAINERFHRAQDVLGCEPHGAPRAFIVNPYAVNFIVY